MELLQRIKSIFRKRHPIEQEPCIQKQDTSTQINKPLNRKRKADTASDTPSEEVLQIHPARKRPRSNPQSQRSALDSSGIRESKTKSTDHDNRRPNANESKKIGQLLENASCSTTIIPQQPLSLSSSLGREGGAVDGLGLIREPAAKKDSYVEKRADRTAYQKWMSSQRVSQKCNVLAKRRAVDGGRVELPKVMLGMHQDRIREKDEKLVEKAPYISKTVSPCVADCDSTKDDRSEALVLADDGVSPSASLASTRGVLPNTKKRKINQDSLASAAKRFRSSLTAAPVEECHLQNHEIEPNSGREEVETDLCPSRPNTNESSPDTKPIAAETLAGILEHLVAKSEEMKKFSEQLEELKSMYKKQAERTGSILTVAPQVSVQPLQQLKESQLVAYLQEFVQHFYQIGSDNAHRQSQTQKEDGLNSSLGSDSRKLGRSNMSISLLNPAHVAPQKDRIRYEAAASECPLLLALGCPRSLGNTINHSPEGKRKIELKQMEAQQQQHSLQPESHQNNPRKQTWQPQHSFKFAPGIPDIPASQRTDEMHLEMLNAALEELLYTLGMLKQYDAPQAFQQDIPTRLSKYLTKYTSRVKTIMPLNSAKILTSSKWNENQLACTADKLIQDWWRHLRTGQCMPNDLFIAIYNLGRILHDTIMQTSQSWHQCNHKNDSQVTSIPLHGTSIDARNIGSDDSLARRGDCRDPELLL